MGLSNNYTPEEISKYVPCPKCGLWYDSTKEHPCPADDSKEKKVLDAILKSLKRIENILERKL